jgi:hypothetical protein
MKLFGSSIWNTVQSEVSTLGTIRGGFEKLCDTTAAHLNVFGRKPAYTSPVTYRMTPALVKTYAISGLPFLTFYEFTDLTGWYRDMYFAPDHVPGYREDIGKDYTVWTRETTSTYHRHIIFDALNNDISISFEVPSLDAASWFPLRIRLFDDDGVYFEHDQKLVVERLSDGKSALTSWKKIPQLAESLPLLHSVSASSSRN